MRLEITLCKEVIRNKFNIDDRYNNLRSRINRHTLILNDELLEIYEKDAKENKYQAQFENWYFSLIGSAKKLRKLNTPVLNPEGQIKEGEEGYLVANLAAISKDKVAVGKIENSISKYYKNTYFIGEDIFNRNKSHTITMGDIGNIWTNKILTHFFDIYETPIRLEIGMGDDSALLGKYLSLFYKDSKKITIKDTYIHKNQRNLDNYVLRYIDRYKTKITFRAFWNQHIRDRLIEKFTNYNGYDTSVIIDNKKLSHHSMIQSDDYIIDIGYRLRVFGDKDDGKTEQEVINISKI